MKEQTIQTFTFAELSDESPAGTYSGHGSPKERARQWIIKGTWDIQADLITELFEQELSERGLHDLKAEYDLSHSQGSGVAFAGRIDLAEIKPIQGEGQESDESHIAAIKAALGDISPDDLGVAVTNSRQNSHAYSFSVEVEDNREDVWGEDGNPEWTEELQREADKPIVALEEIILEWLRDLSRSLEKMGYSEIEYRESDEALAEDAEANEWAFSESGQYIGHLVR